MKRLIIILYMALITSVSLGQGKGNGGPPTPPPGWCQQHPEDPACWGGPVQVPLSDWYWEIGLATVGLLFFYKKFKQLT